MNKAVLVGLLFLYPLAVYFGLQFSEPALIAALFIGVLIARYWLTKGSKVNLAHIKIVTISGLALLGFATFANSELALKFYPVVISSCFLVVFAYSLYKPPSFVEVIASKFETIDEHGKHYTRIVTKVWCVFFIINGLIATATIYHPDPLVWLTYNGFISYVLMGILMAVEFIIRKLKKAKNKSNEMAD